MSNHNNYITKNIVLDPDTKAIVDELVMNRHFGSQGFSLGIRTIIREWHERGELQDHLRVSNSTKPRDDRKVRTP